jgi:U6 snRNA phosphodiesterase
MKPDQILGVRRVTQERRTLLMLVSGATGPYTHGNLHCHPFVRRMKRTRSINLVSYGESSTSEDEGEEDGSETTLPKKRPKSSTSSQPPPPPAATDTKQRKRQLPALAAHLASPVPLDDPSKHQGRTRTIPHVDGQWAAYVYVPIAVRGALRRIVERAVDIARKGEGGSGTSVDVHMLGSSDSNVVACELHVSLTRPFVLRAYQREEMKRAVRDAARAHPP